MCDQTEVTYSPGDVVWVKLGPVWWPGQVQDYDKLPDEITHDLRKRPIAVVKFFQEDTYEYVKNLNQIYHYNCRKKEEFIKKGLDMVRSSNTREVPSNMNMFPNDIVMAEHITGGDPNILESETFAPEQKTNYSDLFGSAKKPTGKKAKAEALKKEFRRHSESPARNSRKSLSNLPATIPRPITHPRFITKALEGKSDHEVRIRCQISLPKDDEEDVNVDRQKYKCHLCDFQSARLNVIVLHNKSHSAGFIDAQNAVKAKLKIKDRERISLGPISLSEQTPPTLTSRGRVKSLPKKLLDYTDEPPPKMLKEKTYSKHVKDESSESPPEIVVEKTPKKQKVVSEKTPLKRPLFGKRKSAKEKAELAAKLKQENEAMKETLLKDWDDDDVNEEEVELERLKQALESTTTSSIEDENDSPPKVKKMSNQENTAGKSKSIMSKNDHDPSSNKPLNDDVKAKVFEFDDSEDCLPVNINFRLKNKQEKFTDDKFKKPRPPKPLSKPKSKSTPPTPPPPLFNEKKEEDKEASDLTEAFNALLEETAVPVLPEIPNSSAISNTSISDQTSDISSSTDLVDATESSGDFAPKMDILPKEPNLVNNDIQMECTSSDNEEVNTSEKIDESNIADLEKQENQKNMMEVSAVPSAETDSEVISSGDATTTYTDMNSLTFEPNSAMDEISMSEDSATTEITSTCEGSKVFVEGKENTDMSGFSLDENIENKTDNSHKDTDKATHDVVSNINDDNRTPSNSQSNACSANSSSLFELNSETLNVQKTEYESVNVCSEIDSEPTSEIMNNLSEDRNEAIQSDLQSSNLNLVLDSNVQGDEKEPKSAVDSENLEEKTLNNQELQNQELQNDMIVDTSEQIVTQEIVSQPESNVQIIVPSSQDSSISTIQSSFNQQQVETFLVSDQGSVVNQTMSQSLQDMELDINSMPVIIGGEDFIQQEEQKPQLIPIQPKYSESIVISPKVNVATSSKPESVIVHFSEPSSSTQNVKSTISLPGKVGKGGRGGKSPKTTSKTIKLSASALKNLGSLPKVGNQQVLILKTAGSKDGQDKGTLPKTQGPLNLIQHGNKILIVNNPQMTGQNKIKLNPQQQQLLTGGKLAPGTRVFTSKVVATTTPPSSDTNKTSTSRSSSKTTQKLVISKGGMLSNVSKGVIINSSPTGKIISTVAGLKNITTSKGQTIVTHNILNTKGGLILPSSQGSTSSNKTTTLITSQNLPSSKGMILTPIASKGGQIISGNQKLRIVSSKAPLTGTKFLVQSSPKKTGAIDSPQKVQHIKLISGLKGQTSGNTIFIQTSQGLVAKSITSNTVSGATTPKAISPALSKTIACSLTSPTKIHMTASPSKSPIVIQQPQSNVAIQQIVEQPMAVQSSSTVKIPKPVTVKPAAVQLRPVAVQPAPTTKKVTLPKPKQNPNILQKPPRKSTPRAPRGGGRAKTQRPKKSEPLILSAPANLPVVAQPSLVQTQIPQNSDGMLYLTIDESGNYRQLDGKSLLTLEGNGAETPRTIYIPASSQSQDVSNVFLTIDDSGMTQLVNIAPPASSTTFSQATPAPAQDILAKALANTQVFQPETMLPDADVSSTLVSSVDSCSLASASFVEQPQYPAPSLSHSVQETSLTLTQPIMTPLEVPSNVSPSLNQISTLPSNFIPSNLLNSKQKSIHPSMPLLTEESLAGQTRGEPIFLLDSSNNIIPLTSGSQTFQLRLDDSMVTMTSGSSGNLLPQTYQVVTSDLLSSQLVNQDSLGVEKGNSIEQQEENSSNMHFTVLQDSSQIPSDELQFNKSSGILREALEAPHAFKSEPPLNSVETTQSKNDTSSDQIETTQDQTGRLVDFVMEETLPENAIHENLISEETSVGNDQISLKRNLDEEEIVTSSSDPQDDSKRIRLEER